MNIKSYKSLVEKANEKNFNGQILLIKGNQRYEYISGIENREKKTHLSRHSIFSIASGTKFLTALAIGKLIDEKKISLDTKVKDILDLGFGYDENIRIKHLLSHTSGMPDYLDESLDELPEMDNIHLYTVSDYLRYFPRREMDFKPGTQFKYNNSAFVYLALIIEKASMMTYQAYINQIVLEPLGITQSGIFRTSADFSNRVMGYIDVSLEKTYIGYIPEMPGGDGGAFMNADDFYHLFKAFMNHEVLSESLTNSFLAPHVLADEKQDEWYGYGLWLKKYDDRFIPFVIGVDPGVRMKAMYDKHQDYYAWMASNVEDDIWDLMSHFDQTFYSQED